MNFIFYITGSSRNLSYGAISFIGVNAVVKNTGMSLHVSQQQGSVVGKQ